MKYGRVDDMERYKRYFNEEIYSVTTEFDSSIPSDEQIVRLAITAEQSAVTLYNQLAHYTNNQKLEKVLLDIAREEKVHIGELQAMLELYIDREEFETQIEGSSEIEDI